MFEVQHGFQVVGAAYKPLDISNEAIVVLREIQKDRWLGPAFVRVRCWSCQAPPVERYLRTIFLIFVNCFHIRRYLGSFIRSEIGGGRDIYTDEGIDGTRDE